MIKRKRLQLNNEGTTLVELIVSFVLLSLFMVAATRVISYTMITYYEAKAIANGMEVCNLISNKISSELEDSLADSFLQMNSKEWKQSERLHFAESTPTTSLNMMLSQDGNKIVYYDKNGNQVCLYVDERGYLVFHYYPIIYGENDPSNRLSDDWVYDPGAYLGYTVNSIKISQAKYNDDGTINGDYNDNILKLEISVHSPKYGEYYVVQYIECYNFRNNSSVIGSVDFTYGQND